MLPRSKPTNSRQKWLWDINVTNVEVSHDGQNCDSVKLAHINGTAGRVHQLHINTCGIITITMTIIIIITTTMFMVLSSWHSHCESSPGYLMNADWAPGGHQPSDQTNRFGLWVRRKIGCYHPQTPSPFVIMIISEEIITRKRGNCKCTVI